MDYSKIPLFEDNGVEGPTHQQGLGAVAPVI